jgi:hypothetical protein
MVENVWYKSYERVRGKKTEINRDFAGGKTIAVCGIGKKREIERERWIKSEKLD